MLHANLVGPGTGDRLLLLIHGYGADEHDLAPLSQVLDPVGRFTTVCPRAPIDLAPFGGMEGFGGAGVGGAAWYDRSEDGVIDPGSFQRSVLGLDHLIDAVCEQRGLQRRRSVIVGFSQGGAMALAVSLRDTTKARPAGVACLSGMLQEPDWLRYLWHVEGGDTVTVPALYVQHGVHDPVVDVERGRRTRATLQRHGIEPEYHEYPMQHEIRPESIVDLRAWLDRVAATP